MPDILGIAEASMRNSMQQLDAVSRNVANVNTQGYKREVYLDRGFQSYLPPSSTNPTESQPAANHDFSAGPLKYTGSPLSLAIEGKGYFQLQTAQGVVLTRDGQFQINQNGQLVSADGALVLMKGAASFDNAEIKALADGTLISGEQRAQLDLVDADPTSLQLVGPGRYRANSVNAVVPGAIQLRQGYIEGSNVDSLTEMVDMMSLVRRVEASQQLMRAYDEITDSAVSTLGQF